MENKVFFKMHVCQRGKVSFEEVEIVQDPAELMREYEIRANGHRFENVAPLIAENALYWFSDGSFCGHDEIKKAFKHTWNTIRDEHYYIDNMQWLGNDNHLAVCTYLFHWQGMVDGQMKQADGRGTSVLGMVDGEWKVLHEHLSVEPSK
jgi:ketosteroid isomerase-like protein